MKKTLLYIFVAFLLISSLSSCILNPKLPKAILTYPNKEISNDLPTKIDVLWNLEGNIDSKDFYFEVYYGKSKSLLDNKISTSNLSVRIENLEPETEYYLKIRTIKGNVYTDSDIYTFKTTDIPKVNFSLNKDITYKNSINLSWNATDNDGIKKYELFISEDPNFSNPIKLYEGTGTTFSISNLERGKVYYIKLIAYDKLNEKNEKTLTINVENLEFSNFYPSNNEKSIPTDEVTLKWDFSISSNFILLFSTNNNLLDDNKYYKRIETSENSYTIKSLPSGTTFYWQVIDKNSNVKSDILSFTTSYKPEIEITYPQKNTEIENYAIGVPENALITWNATDIDNDQLSFVVKIKKIQKNEDISYIDFDEDLLYNVTIYSTSIRVNLEKGSYYALIISADDKKGNITYSNPIKFRTNLPPNSPYNLYPNNIINIPTKEATLSWNAFDPDNGIKYNVYFGNTIDNLDLIATTENNYYTLKNLDYGKTYYWEVESIDSENATSLSTIATFTTNKKPVFLNSSPEDNSSNISLKPTFSWEFSDDNISYYQLFLSKENDPLTLIATLTNNTYEYNKFLNPNTKYKWKVVAFDNCLASSESSINYFTTTQKPNISLVLPNNNYTNSSLKTIFKWDAFDPDNDNLKYTFNLYTENSTISYTLNSTEFKYNDYLLPNTQYSWEVIATDSNYASTVSEKYYFKTTNQPTVTLMFPISNSNISASATLEWNAQDIDNDELQYEIFLNETKVGTTTNTHYVINNLNPNSNYSWKILVTDSNYATVISKEATFKTANSNLTKPNITKIYDYFIPSKEYTLSEEKYPNMFNLYWENSNSAKYYDVYINKYNIDTKIATNLIENYAILNFEKGGRYNLYIKAYDENGFSIKGEKLEINVNQPPLIQDYFPRDNENNLSLNPKIIWYAEDLDSSSFNIRVYFGENIDDLSEEFISNAQSQGEYTIKTKLLPGKTYYWKMVLEDEMHGVTSTKYRKFTTTHKPIINSINLTDNSTDISLKYLLKWNASDEDYDKLNYSIDLYDNNNSLIKSFNTNNQSYILDLDSNSTYKLIFIANDDKGSSASTELSFTTTLKPIIYDNSLTYSCDSNHMNNGEKLKWDAYDPDGDDLSYTIYLGKNINNLSVIGTTLNKEFSLNNLENNTTYYWKIKAEDDKGSFAYSDIKSFKTNALPMYDIEKFYPKNYSIGVEQDLTLKWFFTDFDGDNLSYDIYFGSSLDNLSLIKNNYTNTSFNINNLESGKTYYWKIIAKDSYGGETDSGILSFTTNRPPTNPSISVSDLNKLEFYLSWSSVDPENQHITYDLLSSYNNDTNYSTILYNTELTQKYISRLLPNSTYYFKVRSIDEKEGVSESYINYVTPQIDTNIFTIEKDSSSNDEVINIIEKNNEIFSIIREDNIYYLTKFDNAGTEITTNSSATINITPYFIDVNGNNLVLIGNNNNNLEFEEYDSNLNFKTATTTAIIMNISGYMKDLNKYIIYGTNSNNGEVYVLDNSLSIIKSLNIPDFTINSIIKIYDDDSKYKYLLGGIKNSEGYIIKTDLDLNTEFEKSFNDMNSITSMINNDNNELILLGFTNNDLIIKKISYRFNELQDPVYENGYKNNFSKIIKNSNNEYLILLNTLDNIEILKMDENINIIEKIKFGGDNIDYANGLLNTNDGGYIIFGQTRSFKDTINGNSYIIKTDSKLLGWSTPEE